MDFEIYINYMTNYANKSRDDIIKELSPDFVPRLAVGFLFNQHHKTKPTMVYNTLLPIDEDISEMIYWINKDCFIKRQSLLK
jgi:hypothetical protein